MLKKTGLNGYLFFEKFANDRINKLKEVKKLEQFEQQPANNLKNALLNANYQKPNKAKAIENLKNEFEKLRLHISGFNQNNNLDYFLNQLKYRFDEIEHQQINIEKEHKRLRNQDFNSWTNSEIEMNQIEIDYFHEILNLCDDAKANIIENLAIHNFTFFDGEKKKFLEYLEPDHHLRRKRNEAKPTLQAEIKTIDEPALKEIEKDLPKEPEVIKTEITENPFPDIFTSYIGFKIFEEFKDKEIKNIYADYSFLFNSLKADGFIKNLKHKDFMNFTDTEYETKFSEKYFQFNASTTKPKRDAYSRCKKLFQ
jgi:hypothetical protein